LLNDDNIVALLSGRRTSIVQLKDLAGESFNILKMDAKLSLDTLPDGSNSIKIHPIYKDPLIIADMKLSEGLKLIGGEVPNLLKTIADPGGDEKKVVFEYDPETREFLSYDPAQVTLPHKINGEALTSSQQQLLREGSLVKLSDGTKLQHLIREPKGLISSSPALIISIAGPQGSSTFLLEGINGFPDEEKQQSPFTPAFEKAFLEMPDILGVQSDKTALSGELELLKSQYSRGYGHGISR
jgi:hypothetical protein